MADSDLALLSQARAALAQVHSIPAALEIRDQAAAMQRYLQRRDDSGEAARLANEIRIRAERRIGELLRETVSAGNPQLSHDATIGRLPEGINRSQSHRWQKVAALDEVTFERELRKEEPTTSRMVKVAKQLEVQERTGEAPTFDMCSGADLESLIADGTQYGTIYADPPWHYENQGTRAATNDHYGTMTVEDIAALPIAKLAAPRAHLHIWTTAGFLPRTFEIIEAWGFEYRGFFVWTKPQMGIGNYWRNAAELMLLGVRGGLVFQDHAQLNYLMHDRGEHSAKPERVRGILEKVSPGPRLELFARDVAPGWTVWGNQIERSLFHANARRIA